MGGAGSQGELSLHSRSLFPRQSLVVLTNVPTQVQSFNAKQKAATLQTRGCVCHVKRKLQGAKGPAQVPKMDCKVTTERKAQGAHNQRSLRPQLN